MTDLFSDIGRRYYTEGVSYSATEILTIAPQLLTRL